MKYRDFGLHWLGWNQTMLGLFSVSNPLLLFLLFSLPIHVNITYLVGFIVYDWLIGCSCSVGLVLERKGKSCLHTLRLIN